MAGHLAAWAKVRLLSAIAAHLAIDKKPNGQGKRQGLAQIDTAPLCAGGLLLPQSHYIPHHCPERFEDD